MYERYDLPHMLQEIQEDEASENLKKAAHLSQDQIQKLMMRRKAQDPKPDAKPAAPQ